MKIDALPQWVAYLLVVVGMALILLLPLLGIGAALGLAALLGDKTAEQILPIAEILYLVISGVCITLGMVRLFSSRILVAIAIIILLVCLAIAGAFIISALRGPLRWR